MSIGWPQGIVIGLWVFSLIAASVLDGEPRTGRHKFSGSVIGVALSFALLWWGGFFA